MYRFGLWRVRFPPILVRPGTARRLPVEALGETDQYIYVPPSRSIPITVDALKKKQTVAWSSGPVRAGDAGLFSWPSRLPQALLPLRAPSRARSLPPRPASCRITLFCTLHTPRCRTRLTPSPTRRVCTRLQAARQRTYSLTHARMRAHSCPRSASAGFLGTGVAPRAGSPSNTTPLRQVSRRVPCAQH